MERTRGAGGNTLSAVDAGHSCQRHPPRGLNGRIEPAVHRANNPHRLGFVAGSHAAAAEHALVVVPNDGHGQVIHIVLVHGACKAVPILNAQIQAELLQLAVLVAHAGKALLVVIGKQQLQVDLAGFADGGGIGLHHHSLAHGQHASGLQGARARIHHAQAASADLIDILEVAQGGNIDTCFLGSLQNGRTGRHLNTYAINRKLNEFFHLHFLLSTISSWRSRRSGTFPYKRRT